MTSSAHVRLAAGLLALGLGLTACGGQDPAPEGERPTTHAPSSTSGAPSPSRSSDGPAGSPSAPSSSASSASGQASPDPSVSEASAPGAPSGPATGSADDGTTDADTGTAADDAPSSAAVPDDGGVPEEDLDEAMETDDAVVPVERDLGGPQAGVAAGDTPVSVRSPAPAPVAEKVDPVAPAAPPAATAPTTGGSAQPRPSTPTQSSPSDGTAPAPTATADPSTAAPRPAGPVDCSAVPCVALTFDDGPGRHTARLLDILAAEGVPATFYVVGSSAELNPSLIARMGAEGHQVGNHSYSHPNLTTLDAAGVREEIAATDAAIRAAGVVPSTVRAPYGAQNEAVLDVLGGLPRAGSVTWSVDTRDWEHKDPARTLAEVQASTRPGGIVLMHDIHGTSVDAVPSVIAWLKAQGYTLVTVDTLTGGVAPGTTQGRGLRP